MIYGEYASQIFKYFPIAYWKLSGQLLESTIYGGDYQVSTTSQKTIEPLIYSSFGKTVLLSDVDTLSIENVSEFPVINSNHKEKPFSINFWVRGFNPSNGIQNILSIGQTISLNISRGRILLDFAGLKSVVKIIDDESIYNISIVFNGITAFLYVNGVKGTILDNSMNYSPEVDPAIIFTPGIFESLQISDLAIFGTALDERHLSLLYKIGTKKTNTINQTVTLLNAPIFNPVPPVTNILNRVQIDSENSVFRNTYLDGITVKLLEKQVANINGNIAFNIDHYEFSNGFIKVNPESIDVDTTNTKILISSDTFSTANGCLLYFDYANPLELICNNGTVILRNANTQDEIDSLVIQSEMEIDISFIDGYIYFMGNNSQISINSTNGSIYIGNSLSGTDPYVGNISRFGINYVDFPLSVGKYVLDLSMEYTDTIKPIQDGIVVFSTYIQENSINNFIRFKKTGEVEVRSHTAPFEISDLYSGQNGSTLTAYSAVDSAGVGQKNIPISIKLSDTSISSKQTLSTASVTNFEYISYNSNELYSNNVFSLNSNNENAYAILDKFIDNEKYSNRWIRVNTNGTIAINGTYLNESGGLIDLVNATRAISFKLRIDDVQNLNDILLMSTYSISTVKQDNHSYTLSTSFPSGYLFVNGNLYNGEVFNKYETISIVVLNPETACSLIEFAKLKNFMLSDLFILLNSPNQNEIDDISNYTYRPNSVNITDTDTITIGESVNVNVYIPLFSGR